MRAQRWVFSVSIVAALPFVLSSCRSFLLQDIACTPGDDATCPTDRVCSAQGLCVLPTSTSEGEGEAGAEGEGETPPTGPVVQVRFANEHGVRLLTQTEDNDLVWATDGLGGCIRRVGGDGSATSVHCVAGDESIVGLAVAGPNAFWVVDGATDRLESLPLAATPADAARDLTGPDGGTAQALDVGGPSQLAARIAPDGRTVVAWVVGPTNTTNTVERLILDDALAVESRVRYGCGFGSSPGGLALTSADVMWGVQAGVAHLPIRDGTLNDTAGSYAGYGDDRPDDTGTTGGGWASTTVGAKTAYVATRDPDSDGGGILRGKGDFNANGFHVVVETARKVDPDDNGRHANGLAANANFVFYTTAGSGSSPRGVFRVPVDADVPERLFDIEGNSDGGQLVIDAAFITWAEPGNNRIVRMPLPE